MPFGKKPCEHDPIVGCEECRKQRQRDYLREYQRQRRLDPAERKKDTEVAKKSYHKAAQDPVKLEKRRTRERERSRKRVQDPTYREKKNARGRKYYAIPDVKERHYGTMRAYRDRPEVKQKEREYGRLNKRPYKMVYSVGHSESALIANQNGLCANNRCRQVLSELGPRDIHVDHDHSITDGSANVRGVLCRWCNLGLGNVDDSIDKLLGLIEYLEKWRLKNA